MKLGTPSFEVIYNADENNTVINDIVIAIFNTETGNLDYLTIPAATNYELSEELYSQLSEISNDMPKTIKLKDIPKYFNGLDAYEYGELIINDMLGVEMSYYTKIDDKDFPNYFTKTTTSYYQPKKATFNDTCVYSDAFISSFSKVTVDTVINFLTDYSNNTTSNLNLNNRTKYAKDYGKLDYKKIYYWHAFGDYENAGEDFKIDVKTTKKLVNTILENATYTVTQAEYNDLQKNAENANSKGLNIQVLNGGGIRRLAGKWKDKLNEKGYTVLNTDDYSGDKLTSTKIIVKEENVGLDLVKFFKNATIEVGDVAEGYDIIIVVGTEDDFEE